MKITRVLGFWGGTLVLGTLRVQGVLGGLVYLASVHITVFLKYE
jgi:hypothetical protein